MCMVWLQSCITFLTVPNWIVHFCWVHHHHGKVYKNDFFKQREQSYIITNVSSRHWGGQFPPIFSFYCFFDSAASFKIQLDTWDWTDVTGLVIQWPGSTPETVPEVKVTVRVGKFSLLMKNTVHYHRTLIWSLQSRI